MDVTGQLIVVANDSAKKLHTVVWLQRERTRRVLEECNIDQAEVRQIGPFNTEAGNADEMRIRELLDGGYTTCGHCWPSAIGVSGDGD